MSIEGQAQLRCSCSFRNATDYRSPINGLSEINRFELFYKHCIPTGFPDRLLKEAGENETLGLPGVNAWAREKSFSRSLIVTLQLLSESRRARVRATRMNVRTT